MIVDIISENGAPLRNNLILYRTNAQSRQIEEALLYKNLPYKVV
jgi:DNA helicase-2/ATP-dependent DNA helicase PcrA